MRIFPLRYKLVILLFFISTKSILAQTEDLLLQKFDAIHSMEPAVKLSIAWQKIKESHSNVSPTVLELGTLYCDINKHIEATDTTKLLATEANIIGISKKCSTKVTTTLFIRCASVYYNTLATLPNGWVRTKNFIEQVFKNTYLPIASDSVYADMVYDAAYVYDRNSLWINALNYYQKSIELYNKCSNKNYESIALAHNNLSTTYSQLGDEKMGIKHAKIALDIWYEKYPLNIDKNVMGIGNYIHNLITYGDVLAAKLMLDKMDAYMAKLSLPNYKVVWNSYTKERRWDDEDYYYFTKLKYATAVNDTVNVERYIKRFEQAYKAPRNAYRTERYYYMSSAYELVAFCYKNIGNSNKAYAYFKKQEALEINDFNKMKSAANIAIHQYDNGQYNESFGNTLKALNVYNFPKESYSFYALQALKAILEAHLKKFPDAEKSLSILYTEMLQRSIGSNNFKSISINDFKKRINTTQVQILLKTGNVFKEQNKLSLAHHFYCIAAQLFNWYYNKESYNNELDKLNKEINEQLLQSAIAQKLSQQQLHFVVNIIEQNNSQQLWKKFLYKQSENLHISNSLLLQRNQLLVALFEAEESEKVKLEKQLAIVNKSIAKVSNAYLDFANATIDVTKVQAQLKDEVIISYVNTKNKVFAIIITKQSVNIAAIGAAPHLKALTESYVTAIKNIEQGYSVQSKELYKYLIEPLNIKTSAPIIFIPSDFLNFIPFETLISKVGTPLLFTHSISYSYALTLWKNQQQIPVNKSSNLVTFAPQYEANPLNNLFAKRDNNLYDLKYAKLEADSISAMHKGMLYKNEAATKRNFINTLGKFQLYHLAMHAQLNNDQYDESSLIFSNNEKLYFSQLYALNFPSELVVLSACNTGIGALQNGEGLMSLSRALAYSGVKSSLYSLWSVPDKETADIMISFYGYLKKGDTKNDALKKAKLDFIERNPQKKHPYYWAGFVINGNINAIQSSNKWYYLIASVIIIIAGIVGYFLRKKVTNPLTTS